MKIKFIWNFGYILNIKLNLKKNNFEIFLYDLNKGGIKNWNNCNKVIVIGCS